MGPADALTIGELARRSGVAASALRFYGETGLLPSERGPNGHRRYPRHALRRVAVIRVAQRLGLSLDEIRNALSVLPEGRARTKAEWARLSRTWRRRLDERIASLASLRDDLTGCIGCGCLSLQTCRLSNPDDLAARGGAGPRYLLGDAPATSRS